MRLKWRDNGNELSKLSREIFGNDDLTDVTLTCLGGSPYHAHKMVLAAASTFFRNFFKEVQCKIPQHQVIFLKDIYPAEMGYLLQFIYLGEVDIPSSDLERLIKISRELGIIGLNAVKSEAEKGEENVTPKVAKRKLTPTQKQPPMERQPQDDPTHKKPKVKRDPEPIYVKEEEDEESQGTHMDGDLGEDDNVEDANEDAEHTALVAWRATARNRLPVVARARVRWRCAHARACVCVCACVCLARQVPHSVVARRTAVA